MIMFICSRGLEIGVPFNFFLKAGKGKASTGQLDNTISHVGYLLTIAGG